MGYTVADDPIEGSDLSHLSTYKEALHVRLDGLIEMLEKYGGGECRMELTDGAVLRLTLCDFTGESLCSHCAGTGLEGSEQEWPDEINPN